MDKTKINITMNQSGNGLQIGHVETTKRMTVTEIIEDVKAKMCDFYCKYPGEYDKHKDGDNAYIRALDKQCEKCPLNRL